MSSAHGKFILIGEHSVVYGHKAIAIPLEEAMISMDVLTYHEDYLQSEFYTGSIRTLPESFLSIQSLYIKLKDDLSLPSLKMIVDHQTVIGAGLGASATFAAALTKTLYAYAQKELKQDVLLNYIDFAENISHGKASGIDARAVISSLPIVFENGIIKTFNIHLDAYILVVYSNVVGHTKKAVSKVKYMVDHNNGLQHIQSLQDNTNKAIEAIELKRVIQLGHIFNDTQRILRTLGISHDRIESMIKIALEHGAYGAKLTGGGLGGCIIVLGNKRTVESLKKTYEDMGYNKTFIKYLGENT